MTIEYSYLWVWLQNTKIYSGSVICQVFRDQCKCGIYKQAYNIVKIE